MSKLVDIFKRQVTDKLTTSSVSVSEGQSSNLDFADPVKQTVSSDCLWRDLSRSKMLVAQHLASHEAKGIASPERLSLSNFALKLFKALSVS